jgi:very-short-patch-repair endonuclease
VSATFAWPDYDEQRSRFIEQQGYRGFRFWQVSACR